MLAPKNNAPLSDGWSADKNSDLETYNAELIFHLKATY